MADVAGKPVSRIGDAWGAGGYRIKKSQFKVALPGYNIEESPESDYWHKQSFAQLYWEMAPKDFLKVAADSRYVIEAVKEWGPGKGKQLCKLMKAGVPIDPPRLVLDPRNCQTLAHEGRHRAATALFCGLKRIPVMLTCAKLKESSVSGRTETEPTEANLCLKCLRKGRIIPQDKWTTQQSLYNLHDPDYYDPEEAMDAGSRSRSLTTSAAARRYGAL